MIPVRPSPNGSPLPVVWWVASPLPVVWCGPGVGLLGVVSLLPACGMVWVWVFLRWFPPAFLGLLWVFGILIPTMIMMMMGAMITTIIIIIINSNTLINVSLVGRPVSSARAPGNDYRFIDRRAIIFVTVVDLGAIAIRLQWASCHRDRARQGTRSS